MDVGRGVWWGLGKEAGKVRQGERFMGEWGEVWFWREDVGVVSVVVGR